LENFVDPYAFTSIGDDEELSAIINVHECICLETNTNNLAMTALDGLFPKFVSYGIPKFIRGDAGGENIAIGKFINNIRGADSFLIGKSVNNQRIERFWKDLRQQVITPYYDFFHRLAHDNPDLCDSPKNIWILQHMFLTKLRHEVNRFRDSWNFHKMKSSNFGKMLSPNAQSLLGDRNFYLPLQSNDDFHRRSQEVFRCIEIEYEGRRIQRSETPFINAEVENEYRITCPSLTEKDNINDYLPKVANAFSTANHMACNEIVL
jgi:hypothetical protein